MLLKPDRTVPFGAGVLLPFLGLGLARQRRARRSLQAASAALGGMLAFLLCCACWGPPSRRETAMIIGIFAGAPAVLALGLSLDASLEAWVLARIERWRAADQDG